MRRNTQFNIFAGPNGGNVSSNGGRWWPGLVVFNLSGIKKIALSSNIFKHSRLRNLIVCPVARQNNISSLCDAILP